eukprot:4480498-Prymnesium_polylepis.2
MKAGLSIPYHQARRAMDDGARRSAGDKVSATLTEQLSSRRYTPSDHSESLRMDDSPQRASLGGPPQVTFLQTR